MLSPRHIQHSGLDVLIVPNFVLADRRRPLFEALLAESDWQRPGMVLWGKTVQTRRQVAWHADEGYVYRYSGQEHPWRPWTQAMLELRTDVSDWLETPFNGVLLNHYADGSDYVSPHADDEADLAEGAPIACISLGETRDFVLQHHDGMSFSHPLEDGSLVIMAGDTQKVSKHSIPKRADAKGPRISLTFRVCTRRI